MKALTDLEYLRLNKFRRFWHKFISFFVAIPGFLWGVLKTIGSFFKNIALKFVECLKYVGETFVRGDWKTKTSYVIMGFGSFARGQILRGFLFLALEAAYILFMITTGVPAMSKLNTLGTVDTWRETVTIGGITVEKVYYGDNSFKILL